MQDLMSDTLIRTMGYAGRENVLVMVVRLLPDDWLCARPMRVVTDS
jgi:hypothetical protein